MLNYAIVKIAGKQYKVEPEKEILVNLLTESKAFESDQVLLMVVDGKINSGSPYLKEKLKFEVLGQARGKKIRVATYHAKANYRRIKGAKSMLSRIMLAK